MLETSLLQFKLLTDGAVEYEHIGLGFCVFLKEVCLESSQHVAHEVLISHMYHYLSKPRLTARNVLFLAAVQFLILICPSKPLCRYVGGWRAQQNRVVFLSLLPLTLHPQLL